MSDEELGQAVLAEIEADRAKARLYADGKLRTQDGRHWLTLASPEQKGTLISILMTGEPSPEDEQTILMVLRNEFGETLGRLLATLELPRLRAAIRTKPYPEVLEETLKWVEGCAREG